MKRQTFPLFLEKVVFSLLEDLHTPRSLTVKLLIEHGEWDQLLHLKTDPAQYISSLDYFKDAMATALLSKCTDLPGSNPEDRAKEAVKAFLAAERQCRVTNDRFSSHIMNGPFEDPNDVRVHDLLERVKKTVAEILGKIPSDLSGRHGPGATYDDRGQRTTVPDKMSTQPTVTIEARSLLPFWEDTSWCRELMRDSPNRSDPKVVRGNRFVTVPKDALKDRGICIEPSMNIFFQLGIGGFIRRRLREAGIDLEVGQTIHRQVACESSRTGRFCTVDLSSASDTVAYNLVKFLLPELWFEVLSTLRSPITLVKGESHILEKFSSMGNGFTFELETLLFLSLCVEATRAAGIEPIPGYNIFVYGDDLIVPTQASRNLLAILRYCGFTPNDKKTFITGMFRESCGGDYFNGAAVRPHFIEEYPCGNAAWISLANGLRRVVTEFFGNHYGLGFVKRAWFRTLDAIPTNVRRLRGPVHLGDIVIHDVSCHWNTRDQGTRSGERWWIREILCYIPVAQPIPLSRWNPGAQLASALYGVPSTGPIPRKGGKDTVSGYRFKWVTLF